MTDLSHLMTGFFKARVVAVNPDSEGIEKLNGEYPEKAPNYTWEKDGVDKAVVDVFMTDNKEQNTFKYSIYLEDTEDITRSGKKWYVNCVGDFQCVENTSQLFNSFKQFEEVLEWEGGRPKRVKVVGTKDYRIALKGERDLLHYRKMLSHADVYNPDTNLFYDMEKIFGNDFSELTGELATDNYHFVGLAYIDDALRQRVWKEFLPTSCYAEVNTGMIFTNKANKRTYDRWKASATGEYGVKGQYHLGKLQVFKEEFIKNDKTCSDDKLDFINNIN